MHEVEWNQLDWHLQAAQRRAIQIARLLEVLADPTEPAHTAIKPYQRAVAMTFHRLLLCHQTETDECILFPWFLDNFPESSELWVDECRQIRRLQVALFSESTVGWGNSVNGTGRCAELARLEREHQEIRDLELWPTLACARSSVEVAQLSAQFLSLDTSRLDGRVLSRPLHVLHLLERKLSAPRRVSGTQRDKERLSGDNVDSIDCSLGTSPLACAGLLS